MKYMSNKDRIILESLTRKYSRKEIIREAQAYSDKDVIEEAERKLDELADKYVPAMGMAETCGGEILRAFARLYYRCYNDGDMPYEGYGNETCNSSYRYLTNYSFFRDRLKVCDDCDEWYRRLQAIMPDLYEWLIKRSDLFEVTNNVDSRTPTEADLDAARESEWDDEDDYYDDYDEE
jgi:hypothetical protein